MTPIVATFMDLRPGAADEVGSRATQLKLPPRRRNLYATMARRALHLLLALTLAFNGISAPWAMARMSETSHAGHGTHEHDSLSADAEADTHAMHQARHGGHDMANMAEPAEPAAPMEESCCNGPTCECGCVLPPVVPVMALVLTPQPLFEASFVLPAQHAVLRRGTPPFRPPTV